MYAGTTKSERIKTIKKKKKHIIVKKKKKSITFVYIAGQQVAGGVKFKLKTSTSTNTYKYTFVCVCVYTSKANNMKMEYRKELSSGVLQLSFAVNV